MGILNINILNINIIDILIMIVFLVPILGGITGFYSDMQIRQLLIRILNNMMELATLCLSIILTRKIFIDQDKETFFQKLYDMIPQNIRTIFYGHDIFTYIVFGLIIFACLTLVLNLITAPIFLLFYRYGAGFLSMVLNSRNRLLRYLSRILWKLPRAVLWSLILVIFLHFYVYYQPIAPVNNKIQHSLIYQTVHKRMIVPVLNSELVKKVPIILNDSFKFTLDQYNAPDDDPTGENPLKNSNKHRSIVIKYFNGVTLDEAIKSNAEIDQTARRITGTEKSTKGKAIKIYSWISKNIKYDDQKVIQISRNAEGVSSGSIIAFNTRKGICFDYSCLFVSMCRAAGLKVRLITGLGYSGTAWGDHAWNQVYCTEENRWINVDTTFGTVSNYFDKRNFNTDHRYGEIQGEW